MGLKMSFSKVHKSGKLIYHLFFVVEKRITLIHFPSRFSKIILKNKKAFLECTNSITVTGSSEQGQADGECNFFKHAYEISILSSLRRI